MRWDEGSLRGTTRLKTLSACREKLAFGDLFRRGVAPSAYFAAGSPGGGRRKECLRLWRKLPARPAKPGDTIAAPEGLRALRTSPEEDDLNAKMRFHLCLRRISGAGRRGLAEGAQRRGRAGVRDRPRSRGGGSLGTGQGGARFSRVSGAGPGTGGILPQTAGVCNGEMRLRAACLPLQKNCASFPKND